MKKKSKVSQDNITKQHNLYLKFLRYATNTVSDEIFKEQ